MPKPAILWGPTDTLLLSARDFHEPLVHDIARLTDAPDPVIPAGGTRVDGWDMGSEFRISGEFRGIPVDAADAEESETPWDGTAGFAEFLAYARAGNSFRFYFDRTDADRYIDARLVSPLTGGPDREIDGKRRLRVEMRATTVGIGPIPDDLIPPPPGPDPEPEPEPEICPDPPPALPPLATPVTVLGIWLAPDSILDGDGYVLSVPNRANAAFPLIKRGPDRLYIAPCREFISFKTGTDARLSTDVALGTELSPFSESIGRATFINFARMKSTPPGPTYLDYLIAHMSKPRDFVNGGETIGTSSGATTWLIAAGPLTAGGDPNYFHSNHKAATSTLAYHNSVVTWPDAAPRMLVVRADSIQDGFAVKWQTGVSPAIQTSASKGGSYVSTHLSIPSHGAGGGPTARGSNRIPDLDWWGTILVRGNLSNADLDDIAEWFLTWVPTAVIT